MIVAPEVGCKGIWFCVEGRLPNSLTGFVLAGGRSTRMGTDKALLTLGGETLLARALKTLGPVASDVRILGSAEKFGGGRWPVVEDIFPGCGPLGGIHAALSASASELNLMLAVDLPFVPVPLLNFLIGRAKASGAMVTVPRSGGRFQPLCAVYGKSFTGVAEQALRAGQNKIDPLFSAVRTLIIEQAELEAQGFSPEVFRNLNTPFDWEQACTLFPGGSGI
jgi:molybdopterin-guanine dinucleotide biosynthesis protein A